MAGGRLQLAMESTAIGMVSLNSNSETLMTAICDARLIYGRGGLHGYLYAVQIIMKIDIIHIFSSGDRKHMKCWIFVFKLKQTRTTNSNNICHNVYVQSHIFPGVSLWFRISPERSVSNLIPGTFLASQAIVTTGSGISIIWLDKSHY